MPKTRACSYADRDALIKAGVCPACSQHAGKHSSISIRGGGVYRDDEFHFTGNFWTCDSGASWEHFMLSIGSNTSGPRVTAGVTLPSERVETLTTEVKPSGDD
jgi:hypothetical protein